MSKSLLYRQLQGNWTAGETKRSEVECRQLKKE